MGISIFFLLFDGHEVAGPESDVDRGKGRVLADLDQPLARKLENCEQRHDQRRDALLRIEQLEELDETRLVQAAQDAGSCARAPTAARA